MNRVRTVLVTVLLCAFAALGIGLTFLALMLTGLEAGASEMFDAVLQAWWVVLLVSGLLLALPAFAALVLMVRQPNAGRAVACLLGLGVFCATASEARDYGSLLVVNLAGIALVLCALPMPTARPERGTR